MSYAGPNQMYLPGANQSEGCILHVSAQRAHASRVIVQDAGPFEHTARDMTQHTLFAVDFLERADRCSPTCGQERQRRSSGRGIRVGEALERIGLSDQLSALACAESQLAVHVRSDN